MTNPAFAVTAATDRCLALAESWIGWNGRPIVTDGANLWTPLKAVRRIQDHLIDHLAEVEALLAGEPPLATSWHGRMVTVDSDWARFTELDLHEVRARWPRLAQSYVHRYATVPDGWDSPRTPNWTLREITEHVAGITWYAEQVGEIRFGDSAVIR